MRLYSCRKLGVTRWRRHFSAGRLPVRRRRYDGRHQTGWLWFIVVLLLIPPVAAVVLFLTRKDAVALVGLIPSWLFILVELAYRYSERIHMLVERARLWLLGGGATWGARAEFDGKAVDADQLRQLTNLLLSKDKKAVLVAEEPSKRVIQVLGLTIAIATHTAVAGPDNEAKRTLVLEVLPDEWPLRRAIELATGLVPLLFEEVSHLVSPTDAKYSAELRFPAGNPYFGFFVKNLQLSKIDRFIDGAQLTQA